MGLDVEASDRHTKMKVLKLSERRLASSELASLQGASLLVVPSASNASDSDNTSFCKHSAICYLCLGLQACY